MLNYVGYIFIFLLIVLLTVIFKFVILYEISTNKRYFEVEISKIRTTTDLRVIQNRIVEIKKELDNYPLIAIYLGQVDTILEKHSYEFNDLKIVRFSDKNLKNSAFDGAKFFEEYKMAPGKIREEVVRISNILGNIYSWEHPLLYKYETFKKNMILQILLKLIKILENKSENSERKTKLEQEKRQNICRYLPAIN